MNRLQFEYNTETGKCFLLPGAQASDPFNICRLNNSGKRAEKNVVYNRAEDIPYDLGDDAMRQALQQVVDCSSEETPQIFKMPEIDCGEGKWDNNGTCTEKTRSQCPEGYGLYFYNDNTKDSKCYKCPANMYSTGGSGKCLPKSRAPCPRGQRRMMFNETKDDVCYEETEITRCLKGLDGYTMNGELCTYSLARPPMSTKYDFCDADCQINMEW